MTLKGEAQATAETCQSNETDSNEGSEGDSNGTVESTTGEYI